MHSIEVKFTQHPTHTAGQTIAVSISSHGDELEMMVCAMQAMAISLGFSPSAASRITLLPASPGRLNL